MSIAAELWWTSAAIAMVRAMTLKRAAAISCCGNVPIDVN
jgi:hypothetical protein